MNTQSGRAWLLCSVLVLGAAPTCRAADPEVPVFQPVVREVVDHEDFTGRTEAAQLVDLRARVTGYVVKTAFKEGADVKKGDLLFELDARPYQAQLSQALTELTVAEASLKLARTVYERDRALFAKAPGTVSQQQLDQDQANVDEAVARLQARKATVDYYKLNVDFTKITAPFDGHIGRQLITPGNLVKADDSVLATIVSRDPMYVYFDVDERTLLRMRRAQRADRTTEKATALPAALALADEKGFPHSGKVDFTDVRVDPATGTLRMRMIVPNTDQFLLPGMFVRVRLTTSAPHKAMLVPVGAVLGDKDEAFVLVVNDKNVVERRQVELGKEHAGLREVTGEGLKANDWLVLNGAKAPRPGTAVQPKKVDVPAVPD